MEEEQRLLKEAITQVSKENDNEEEDNNGQDAQEEKLLKQAIALSLEGENNKCNVHYKMLNIQNILLNEYELWYNCRCYCTKPYLWLNWMWSECWERWSLHWVSLCQLLQQGKPEEGLAISQVEELCF